MKKTFKSGRTVHQQPIIKRWLPGSMLLVCSSVGMATDAGNIGTYSIAAPVKDLVGELATAKTHSASFKASVMAKASQPHAAVGADAAKSIAANVSAAINGGVAKQLRGATIAEFTGFTSPQQKVMQSLQSSSAAVPVKVAFSGATGTPRFITGLQNVKPKAQSRSLIAGAVETPRERAESMLMELAPLFKIKESKTEFAVQDAQKQADGTTHFHVQQQLNGIPVFGRELRVHLDTNSQVYAINGDTIPTVDNAVSKPAITETQAIDAALKQMGVSSSDNYELTVSPHLTYFQDGKVLKLTYSFNVMVGQDVHWQFFVSAQDASIVHRYTLVASEVVKASGTDLHGAKLNFNSWHQNNAYYAIDPTLPNNAGPYDPLNSINGDLLVLDAQNQSEKIFTTGSANPNSGWDPKAISAMSNTLTVYNYYLNTHHRDSYDGQKGNLIAIINVGVNMDNATWNGKTMNYGNGGGGVFKETTLCLDVAGHEMSHGVVQTTANLVYENQSGALNESFADVFGAMVDRSDWLMGEDCTAMAPGFIRNMADPHEGVSAQPAHMSEYNNYPLDHDNGGVHSNSGIPNRAAYLIAEGLSKEGLGTSIGREKTEQIYYRALSNYLTATSQFIDARRAIEQAAKDLYPNDGAADAVAKAFDAVGVTEDGSSGGGKPNPSDPVSGDDYVIYLYQNSNGYHPFVYSFGSNFTKYNEDDDHPIGSSNAAQTRPAMATEQGVTYGFFVDTDNNLRFVDVATNKETVVDANNSARSMTMSSDGRYFAFTTTAMDNKIYLADLSDANASTQVIEIPSISYSEDKTTSTTVLFADGMNFNAKNSQLIFDVANCISLPNDPCTDSGGGYTFWTIGIYNMAAGTVSYPISSQDPKISIGFPAFSRTNDYVVALDLIDYRSGSAKSNTMLADFNQGKVVQLIDHGDGEIFSSPTFWGDDKYLVYASTYSDGLSTYRLPIDIANLQPTGQPQWIGNDVAEYPIAHRAGNLDTSAPIQVDSNVVQLLGDSSNGYKSRVVLKNSQPFDVKIVSIEVSSDFVQNGINQVIPRNGQYAFDVMLKDANISQQITGNLIVKTETGQTLTIGLSATPKNGPDRGTGGGNHLSGGGHGGGGGAFLPLELLVLTGGVAAFRRSRRRQSRFKPAGCV